MTPHNHPDRWREYDPDANQLIEYNQLPNLLSDLDSPMGIKDVSWDELADLNMSVQHKLQLKRGSLTPLADQSTLDTKSTAWMCSTPLPVAALLERVR